MKHILIAMILVILVPGLLSAVNPRSTTQDGLDLYNNEEYDKALAEFMAALESAPDRKELPYNIGTTLFKLGNYPEAQGAFSKALDGKDPEIAADAWYNLGNAQVQAGNLEEALTSYKNALRVRHDDMDAKYNLESVLKMMQMQPPQQQQCQQCDSTCQDKKDQDQQQQQQQKEQEEQQQASQSEQINQADQDSTGQSAQPQETEMTPEEAMQLLQALENDEQEAQKEKLKRQFGQPKKVEKDW